MPLVSARSREDLDAIPARKLILSRKGIVVDANFADRFLRRDLAVRETIDFDLCVAAGFGIGWSSHRLQRRGECLWIVRERFEIATAQHEGVLIVVRIGADVSIVYGDLLVFEGHFELRVDCLELARLNLDLFLFVHTESR